MITLTLYVKEIIFDIQNKTFLTGRSREAEAETGFEAASFMQASDDSEYNYQLLRSVSNALADLKSTMSDYMEASATTIDNLINGSVDEMEEVNLNIEVPSNYNLAAADNLAAAIHQYIVNRSISDWFTITNKKDAEDYAKLAQEALGTVKRALYKRKRPERPSYKTN